MEKEHLGYAAYHAAIKILFHKIQKDKVNNNIKYDGIYAVPNSGFIPAVHLAHLLELPLLLKPTRHTLVVDDCSDSGATLENVKNLHTAVIWIRNDTQPKPTYYAHVFNHKNYVVHFWEEL
jgi:hypoxanthine phosphoribosyltransferase